VSNLLTAIMILASLLLSLLSFAIIILGCILSEFREFNRIHELRSMIQICDHSKQLGHCFKCKTWATFSKYSHEEFEERSEVKND
jgi:hypothetical protein